MSLADRISMWMAERLQDAGARGFVVGLSGGVDSAVVAALAQRAVRQMEPGPHVLGVLMPCHSLPEDQELAELLARTLGIVTITVDLTSAYDALLVTVPLGSELALSNLKPRLRMTTLYYLANDRGYLVAGTGNKSELMVGYFCYDERTRALTTEGLKTCKELRPGDIVFSLELETGQVIESSVADVHIFDYEGEMLTYGGGQYSRVDLMVTPNHRLLIERGGRLEFCRADEMPRRPTPTPSPKTWAGTRPPSSVFKFDHSGIGENARRFAPMAMEEFLYMLGLYIGDGHAQSSSIAQPVKGSGRRHDPHTGRFIHGDAPPTLKEYTGHRTWFALPKGTEPRSKLVHLLEKNSIEYGMTEAQIWIYGRPFYLAMAECGTSAHEKRIPSWVLDYPAEYLMQLLEGLMDSDGDKRGHYYTVSQGLAEQIAELGCKIGKNVTLRARPPRTAMRADGVPIRSSLSYEISIYGNGRRWLRGAEFKRVPYHGSVWCPDVPGVHNLMVERNGRFLFCGNTKYGDGGVDLLPLGGLLKTQVWALARELGVPDAIVDRAPTAGLRPGQTDEGDLGITYAELDRTLAAIDRGDTSAIDPATLAQVQAMIARSAHKRAMPPIFEP